MTRPTAAISTRRDRSAALIDAVTQVIDANVAAGQMMSASEVARQAGCHRDFLYRHGFAGTDSPIAAANRRIAGDRAAQVDLSNRQTVHALEVDLANTMADNQALRTYVKALERRLGEQIGARDASGPDPAVRIEQLVEDNDRLRKRVVELQEEQDELRHRLQLLMRDVNAAAVVELDSGSTGRG